MDRPVVLVAEDDASVRLTIKFILADEGYEMLFAEDGEQALELARARHPNVILLDQMMPKMDGQQVLAALREDQTMNDVRVLVLSGMARGATAEWPGAEFVGKPFSPDELIERIRRVLERPAQP